MILLTLNVFVIVFIFAFNKEQLQLSVSMQYEKLGFILSFLGLDEYGKNIRVLQNNRI